MIPDSVWAEAKRRDVSAVDFWLSLTETVRDTLHQRALNEGATRVGITQAIDEVEARYPFVAEKEPNATPFQAKQAWFHFQDLLGLPRVIPYMEVFDEAVRIHVESVESGSWYLSGVKALKVVDDGDPEGGVVVNVTYGIAERRDAEPEKIREWIEKHLEARMPLWSMTGGRSYQIEFEGTNFEGADLVHVAFYYPGPRITGTNYMSLAYRIWKARGDYEDAVIAIRERGRYLETVRRSNKNPTTMSPFSMDRSLGLTPPIRHHGEHIYITKRLLQLAEEAP